MKTIIKNTLLSFASLAVALAGFGLTAQAQQQTLVQQPNVVQQYVVPPVGPPVQPQNQFYFGFSGVLNSNGFSKTLRIVSITPGSPAHRAGLEVGDEICSVNGQTFSYARDSFEAVRLLNQFVSSGGVGGGPAPAVATAVAQPYYSPQPTASMVVRNVRNGQKVSVTVHPTRRFSPSPAPAAAAPAAR